MCENFSSKRPKNDFFIRGWGDTFLRRRHKDDSDEAFSAYYRGLLTDANDEVLDHYTFEPDSSWVRKVTYFYFTQELEVKTDRGTYTYYYVPKPVFDALTEADSVGNFMNNNVKGLYNYSFTTIALQL